MLINFIFNIICTFIFYKSADKFIRKDSLKDYEEKSIAIGVYDEIYINEYDNFLKGKCEQLTIVFFIIMTLNMFMGPIFSMIVGIIAGMIISKVSNRFYPRPKIERN